VQVLTAYNSAVNRTVGGGRFVLSFRGASTAGVSVTNLTERTL
jgi:hypothetical protein